jgi:hypothetical protein
MLTEVAYIIWRFGFVAIAATVLKGALRMPETREENTIQTDFLFRIL